jgi:hypothetical protein
LIGWDEFSANWLYFYAQNNDILTMPLFGFNVQGLMLKDTDSAGFCGCRVFAQTVHESFGRFRTSFSRIHEWTDANSSIRGLIRGWAAVKPQIPLEPGKLIPPLTIQH